MQNPQPPPPPPGMLAVHVDPSKPHSGPYPQRSVKRRPRRLISEMAGRQLGIEAWLNALGLHEYMPVFSSYSRVEELLMMTETDIRDLGIRNSAHRARIISSLVIMRDKVHRKPGTYRTMTPPGVSPVHSNSASPPSFVNHPDYAALQLPYQPLQPNPLSPHTPAPYPSQCSDNAHDLQNYLWYHGNIPRQKAEKLVCKDGDFLIRDSISQPGDYVLTCRWSGSPLHFVINRQIAGEDSGGNPKISYQFEDNMFDRVAELVQFYIANKKQVSEMSGALMLYPINRYQGVDAKFGYGLGPAFGLRIAQNISGSKSVGHSPAVSPRMSPMTTPTQSPPSMRRQKRSGSQPLLSLDEGSENTPLERRGSLPQMMVVNIATGDQKGQYSQGSSQTGSQTSLLETKRQDDASAMGGKPNGMPPPKPSLAPGGKFRRPLVEIRNKDLYEDDGKDYTDYAQVKSWASAASQSSSSSGEANFQRSDSQKEENEYDNNFGANVTYTDNDYDVPRSNAPALPMSGQNGTSALYDVPKNFNMPSNSADSSHLSLELQERSNLTVGRVDVRSITSPNFDEETCYDYEVFATGLLPKDNKPLDSTSIATIKTLIMESNPRMLAQHLTYVDLQVLKVSGQHDLGMGVFSGLELLTLPQGHRLRQDLLERHQSLKMFIALTIMTCIKYPERACMLHQWIQVATELKGAIGNLYGFSTVMAGLKSVQITRLKNTWILLRHNFASTSMLYEAKLNPILKGMDEGGSSLPLQNVTIPHIIPLVEVMERELSNLSAMEFWEETKADYGLEVLLTHLDTARVITEQCGLYRVTSENVLRDFVPDRDLEDLFRTELHLRIMWGARGAGMSRQDRYSKFGQVLSVLSERIEPTQVPVDHETSL